MVTKILLGPVLSFRGSSKGKWKVSALIGIGELDKAPKLVVDGKRHQTAWCYSSMAGASICATT